jgi:hypothetical protein
VNLFNEDGNGSAGGDIPPCGRPTERQSTRRDTQDDAYRKSDVSAKRIFMRGLIAERPRTCDEIVSLGFAHQSASAAINWLMRKGMIVDSGERRKTRMGRRAIVWRMTEEGTPAPRPRPTRRELARRIDRALDALQRDVVLESLCRLPIAILRGESTNA